LRELRRAVWRHYRTNGRHTLPWRQTNDPYAILVSEVMLQQTQVARVLPKYELFLKKFPTVATLVRAPLADVLRLWQGLGYNRRAKYLKQAAEAVMSRHQGVFPRTYEDLKTLPGVGAYTAGAIMAFSYNEGIPVIETNIRTVFLHHCFKQADRPVSDKELLPLIAAALPKGRARRWYTALMDYGSFLKQTETISTSMSTACKKQAPFKDSDRFWRGRIMAYVVAEAAACRKSALARAFRTLARERLETLLERLAQDGLLEKTGRASYQVPNENQ